MEGLSEWLATETGYKSTNVYGDGPKQDAAPPGYILAADGRYLLACRGDGTMSIKGARETLEALGLDPIHEIGLACKGGALTAGQRVATLIQLAEFVHPKLARTELTGRDGQSIEFSVTERVSRLAALFDAAAEARARQLARDGPVVTIAGPADRSGE